MAILNPNFSLQEIIVVGISYLYTKLFWKNARLIRLPIRMRGKKAFIYGHGLTTGYSCRIEIGGDLKKTKLKIGDNCIIGDYAHIVANSSVTIGNNVLMASRVFISDTSHGSYKGDENDSSPDSDPNMRKLHFLDVSIGDNVWIGENVSILPGSEIGKGCVIGANTVVRGIFTESCILVGTPARVIKRYCQHSHKWERTEHSGSTAL